MSDAEKLEALNARLDAEPQNWGLRLVIADLHDDMGEPVLAAGQRWMAGHQKAPFKGPTDHWGWLTSRWRPYVGEIPILPRPISLLVSAIYETRCEAEAALAQALAATEKTSVKTVPASYE